MTMTPSLSHVRPLALALAAAAALMAPAVQAANETTRVIVAFKPGAQGAIRNAVAAARGSVKLEIHGMDAMAVELPTQALAGLSRNPNVEYVEEDAKRYAFAAATASTGTPYASGQWVPYGVTMVQADQLATALSGVAPGTGKKVCIIDSGYDRAHEDLSAGGNVTGEYDAGTGWWYTDENSHGTHVAGTIAALNAAGTGVVGVDPKGVLKLHIVKVFGADGWAYSSNLVTAANKCRDAQANVISMSLGGSISSRTEQTAFKTLLNTNGILPIAAAGNGGSSRTSYPAGYADVVSVAAVDEFKAWATFSQYNKDVEIAGPGVNVMSTVPMGTGLAPSLNVGGTAYLPGSMEGSPTTSGTGTLFDFGLGDAPNAAAAGKVCLIARGSVDFATKVSNCQASGGVGAVVYNNVAGDFAGTLGTAATAIPSVTASQALGKELIGKVGQSATVAVGPSNYANFDGTSMATPHVSAVAALVWTLKPACTAVQLRNSLNLSAQDLGTAGRDTKFGYGLVQAKAAVDRITARGCGL